MVKLSLCLITKDEEHHIAACIESASEIADEIVLVDTGSHDATIRIASSYGTRIYEYPWRENFATARNETLKHAKGDWILALDADERLDAANRKKIRQVLVNPEYPAYLLQLWCPYKLRGTIQGISTALAVRLFQNNIGLCYRGRLHERIVNHTARREINIANTNIIINHLGYQDNLESKYRRNLSVARRQKTKHNAFSRYDMARMRIGLGQYTEATKQLKRGLEIIGAEIWLRAQMYVLLGDILIYAERDTAAALAAWQQAAEIDKRIVAPRLRLGRAYYQREEFKAAAKQFESIIDLLSLGSLRGAVLDDECTLSDAYASLSACYLRSDQRENAADALVKSRTPVAEDQTVKVIPWDTTGQHRSGFS